MLSIFFKCSCNSSLNSSISSWHIISQFFIRSICSDKLADDKSETLRKRLFDPNKEYDRLFTFLKYPEVQPTNNQAEQSLRNMVIFLEKFASEPALPRDLIPIACCPAF
ncbi:MAG: hypothetical protein DRH24_01475 [Deltaproteobacteria bacterium]|nr:MAG: hypothetical protein DRH24_01475 [Deltaproteobacteria bacterium]